MEIKAEANPTMRLTFDGKLEITLTTEKRHAKDLEQYKNCELSVKILRYTEKRSQSQNSYMWTLLNQLGSKLNESKEKLYKIYIKDYGSFEILPIKNEAVNKFVKGWEKNGIGWFCEDLGESKLDGYTKIMAYYGTSSYNSKEMSVLLEAIIKDCEEQGIPTLTTEEIMSLKNDND